MKTTLLFLFSLIACHTQAQTLRGQVTDSLTREPLPGATVTLHREGETSILDYAITDGEGRFSFKRSEVKALNISITYLGYKKKTLPAILGKEMRIELLPDAIALKEVTIQSGRISMRQDTIKYDLARFATSKDSNVKDVLKKLPGIDVDENTGQISYQGKAISNFYVEGMDVTGGSYNQVNENLKADAVESAEVIERHQPIRSLRNKVPTDKIALNLKLKPDARAKWIWNTQAAFGYGDEPLYDVRLNALQLAKGKQGLYTYKGNHSGKDLTTELQQLTSNDVHSSEEIPMLVGVPAFSMPLEKHRLLDNDTHLLSLNRIRRKDEINQNRLSFRYLHDEQGRKQGTDETYHYPSDTLRIVDTQDHRLRTDLLRADWDYEKNADQAFTRNVLMFQGKRADVWSEMRGDFDLTQRIRTEQVEAENRFNTMYNKENHTWGLRSYLHYTYLPSSLKFGDTKQDIDLHQAYTDNHFYYLRKRNGFGIELTTGINGRLTSMEDFKAHRLQLYAQPTFSWERNNFRIAATPVVDWERYPNQKESRTHFNPRLYLRHNISSRWSIQASASLHHQSESPEAFYPSTYYADYRTLVRMKEEIGSIQSYMLYTEYKRPVKEFFWTLMLNHFNTRRDYLTHTDYQGKEFVLTSLEHRNRTENYQARSIISKGFYDWNLKASLEGIYNYGKGKQAGQGIIQPYETRWLSLKPKISWTPSVWFSASYQSTLTRSETRISIPLPALWEVQQRLSLSIGNEDLSLNLNGEHYYNELSADESKSTWLADVSIQYNAGKWRWALSLNNLFNQEEYRYTTYSDVRSFTSWMKIRPRECLVSVQYRW
ncbi:MAG: TonB-dependent receptor [Bacteroidaceae bacterium]|nr:TonB-dependent receptor [Bacteroidaceae bacterium]